MKLLFELAKIIAKKAASLAKRKKDEFGDPYTRRMREDIELSFGPGTTQNAELKKKLLDEHNRTERVIVGRLGGERRKGRERRKPPKSLGNGN